MKKKKYINSVFLILLGVITSFSLAPFNFFIINFFTFSIFYFFLVKQLNKHKSLMLFFSYGWLFGFGYFFSNLYWISISLTFDPNFKFLIPFSVVLIPAFLAVFYGIISYLFALINLKRIISSFLIFSLIFGFLEFVRGSIFTGFPWNLIIFSLSNQLEFLSIASIIGTYGLNLFCISLFTCPALIFLKNSRKNKGVFMAFIAVSFLFYMYGNAYEKRFNNAAEESFEYKVRAIGSNIGLDRYYKDIDTLSVMNDLLELSNPIEDEKTIFVWPEAILPNVFQDEMIQFKNLIGKNLNKNHLLMIGNKSKLSTDHSEKFFNSFSLYDNELNIIDSYNKINLVPFGEFLPFENLLGKFGLSSLTNNYQSFSKGEKRNIIDLNQEKFSLKILPLICYEIIYSGNLFIKQNFDLMINISEDGWFGKSIGPKQHFAHSIFRAIENGKYIIRSSNNGMTAIINPIGIIEKKIDYGKDGYIDFNELRKIKPTLFSKYGNKIFGFIILLYIFLIFSFNRFKNE